MRGSIVRHRSDFVKKLWVIATYYHEDNKAREIIDEAVNDKAEYSAFARELRRHIGNRPGRES